MNKSDLGQEINSALAKAAKGLTARQLLDQCESAGDLSELVKVIHAMKADGGIKADGMRESHVIYKLGNGAAPKEATQAEPLVLAPSKSRRSFAGLREGLFDMLDKQAEGKVEPNHAKAYANTAMAILKSLEVQLELERLRYAKQLPQTLDDTPLAMMLEKK